MQLQLKHLFCFHSAINYLFIRLLEYFRYIVRLFAVMLPTDFLGVLFILQVTQVFINGIPNHLI
jgi:hypothetical protein